MEGSCFAIWVALNRRCYEHRASDNRLRDKSEKTSEYARGSEAIDDSPGPEVLALLVGGHRTKLSGSEIVASGVVGGLLVSYLCWGAGEEGPMAVPPSECGICGASAAWGWESLSTWAEEALYLVVCICEGTGGVHRVRAMSKMEGEPRVHAPRGCGIKSSKWDARGAWYRMEKSEVARWQGKMRDLQGVGCLQNGDFRVQEV